DHIRAVAEAVNGVAPRPLPARSWLQSRSVIRDPGSAQPRDSSDPGSRTADPEFTQFSGLEVLTIRPDSNFQMIGERTNVTGSARFARLIKAGNYAEAVSVAADQVRGGATLRD